MATAIVRDWLCLGHLCGKDHPYVGRPCLLDGQIGIIYGCNRESDDETFAVVCLEKNDQIAVALKVEDGEKLTIVEPGSFRGREILHQVTYALVDQLRELQEQQRDRTGPRRSWDD